MDKHITTYQEIGSDKIIGEKIEFPNNQVLFVLRGVLDISFIADNNYFDEFMSVKDQIRDENFWLFDGDEDTELEELDFALNIDFEERFYDKKEEFECVKDDSDGTYLIKFAVYKNKTNKNDLFVIISRSLEDEEKELSFFTARRYY